MQRPDAPLKALVWMAVSAVGFTAMNAGVKVLARELPQMELVFFRALVNWIWVAGLIAARGERFVPPPGTLTILGLRGLFGFLSVCCLFYSLARLTFPIASLLAWTSPLFAILLASLFLKEHLLRRQLYWIPVAFLGLIILIQPGATEVGPPLAVIIALAGSVLAGAAYSAVRAATARVGANLVVFYFVGVASLLAFPFMVNNFVWPSGHQWVAIAWLGTAAAVGQICMTRAYMFAKAGEVSLMGLLNPLFSTGVGVLAFGEWLTWSQGLGALLLLGAVVAVSATGAKLR